MESSLIADPAVAEMVKSSSQRDIFMAIFIGVISVVYSMEKILPIILKMRGGKKKDCGEEWQEGVRILTQKDVDGNSVFLSIPRMLREFTNAMNGFISQVTHLVNHQSETLLKMDRNSHETLQILSKLKESTERFQKDFRTKDSHPE